MSAILEDQSAWDAFSPPLPPNFHHIEESLNIDVLEWYSDTTKATRVYPPLNTAKALVDRDDEPESTCSLRIVFAPRDPPDIPGRAAFNAIYKHYSFPSCWITERSCEVTHSFGGLKVINDPNVDIAWMRLVCKIVETQQTVKVGDLQFFNIVDGHEGRAQAGSQESSRWWHLDALLHTRERRDGSKCVTLLCFSKRHDIVTRFQQLLSGDAWEDAVEQPYVLFSVLLEKWYLTLDHVSWRLADVFRPIETLTLRRSARRQSSRPVDVDKDEDIIPDLDFAGLHNLSKHCTYLLEGAEAALLVLENMTLHHRFLHASTRNAIVKCNSSIPHLPEDSLPIIQASFAKPRETHGQPDQPLLQPGNAGGQSNNEERQPRHEGHRHSNAHLPASHRHSFRLQHALLRRRLRLETQDAASRKLLLDLLGDYAPADGRALGVVGALVLQNEERASGWWTAEGAVSSAEPT